MIQRLLALLITQWLLTGIAFAAPASDTTRTTNSRTPETTFLKGLDCLKQSDLACAEVAAATIPGQSPYAKLLAGNIAAAKGDFDTAFRLLLPLQVNTGLSTEATASLHISLAQAYAAQADPIRALDQRIQAQASLANPTDIQANQQAIWALLSGLSKDQLIEMRGESANTAAQGWIDLALAVQRREGTAQALADWQKIYPDHAAAGGFAENLAEKLDSGPAASTRAQALTGPIALILPLSVQAFYPASDAIERGFVAAQTAAGDKNELRMYATRADKNEIATIYQHALNEGVKYIVGPVTDAEVAYLAGNEIPVPTLALNQTQDTGRPAKLYAYGLSVHDEARQLAAMAQAQGMQNAVVIATSSGLSHLMAEAFREAWTAGTGLTARQIDVIDDAAMPELRNTLASQSVDFIVLAADYEEARRLRPYLDIAIPTLGFSHIYSGLAYDPANAVLSGIRFVDTPWVLKPDSAAFSKYQNAARDLPPGEMQRWFALGADAYRLLTAIVRESLEPATINGLTGKIRISPAGEITRELAVARFGADGVAVEHLP
jgi:outer membrane PBP1 activator LpoA protein